MDSIREYWRRVRQMQGELEQQFPDGVVYLAFLDHPGPITACDPEIAAKTLLCGKHRLASESETEAYSQAQGIRSRLGHFNKRHDDGDREQFVVNLTPPPDAA